jgi:uncharacterized protein (DUF697 family)
MNAFVPTSIEYFLEDHENKDDDKAAILRLVMTLKYWTNPEGAYQFSLTKNELKEYFTVLEDIVQHPEKILPETTLTEKDKKLARDVLYHKLNAEADNLIEQHQLKDTMDKKINNPKKVNEWWSNQSEEQKESIKKQYNALNDDQRQYIAKQAKVKHQEYKRVTVTHFDIDPFLYFYMCNDAARINCMLLSHALNASVEVGKIVIHGAGRAISSIGSVSTPSCGGGSGGSNNDGFLVVVGIAGFVTIISSGVIAGAYGLKKTFNSLKNIYENKKLARSIFRLAGIGVGGYYGALEVGALGALLGSFVPGIGTGAGFIVGAFFGTGIGAGLGAMAAKYIAKGLSYLAYQDEINPSNPEKYQLTSEQIKLLQDKQFNIKVINRMLKAARKEKNKIGSMSSWPWSDERKQKDWWNQQIEAIKNGDVEKCQINNRFYNARFNELGKPYVVEEDQRITTSTELYYQRIGVPKIDVLTVDVPAPSAPLEEELELDVIHAPYVVLEEKEMPVPEVFSQDSYQTPKIMGLK